MSLAGASMRSTTSLSFIDAAKGLATQILAAANEIEQSRRLPASLVESMAQAGLFHLWIPRALGGEETDPLTFVRVLEEVSKADGAVGWCLAICGARSVIRQGRAKRAPQVGAPCRAGRSPRLHHASRPCPNRFDTQASRYQF